MTTISVMKNKTKSKTLPSKKKSDSVLSKKTKKQKLKVVYDVKIKKPKSVTKQKKNTSGQTDLSPRITIEVKRDSDVDIIPKSTDIDNVDDETVTLDDEPKKVRRRGRNKKEKIYFSKATEEAIIEYNAETDFDNVTPFITNVSSLALKSWWRIFIIHSSSRILTMVHLKFKKKRWLILLPTYISFKLVKVKHLVISVLLPRTI